VDEPHDVTREKSQHSHQPGDSEQPPNAPEMPSGADGAPDGTHIAAATRTAWCSNCRRDVESSPRSHNNCGICGTFLRGHTASQKAPVNVHRRRQLLDGLLKDYEPRTELQKTYCEKLASTTERWERAREGSPEQRRMWDQMQFLIDKLEASRSAPSLDDPRRVVRIERVLLVSGVERALPEPSSALPPAAGEASGAGPGLDHPATGPEPRAKPCSSGATKSKPREATSEPDPMYAAGRLVTERDVRTCLAGQGDDVLDAYERGELSKSEAYERARVWLESQATMLTGSLRRVTW
jgi:hypothetical protein